MKLYGNKFDRGVSLLCWAYNEEDSIIDFLEHATNLLDSTISNYEIVLIDDGSTDSTYELARQFKEKNPRLKIFRNRKNLNVGFSSRRAIQEATKEFLFWQTVDWCYDISRIRIFVEYLKRYDIVQGVRRDPVSVRIRFLKPIVFLLRLFGLKHLTKRSDTVTKAIVSVFNYILIRILFRIPLSDFQNVTFYPTKWIQSVEFEAKSSFVNPEGLIKSYWNGMSIKEVPINFLPRRKGMAKGASFKSVKRSVVDIISLWFKWIIMGERELQKMGKIERLKSAEWVS